VVASAVVGRVGDIESGCASDEKRSEPLLKSGARASAQRTPGKNLPVPDRAATTCLFPRGGRQINASVRACVARPYGASCNVRRGGDGGGNGGRTVAAGYRRGVRKYVVAYCRPFARGPMVVHRCRVLRWRFFQNELCQDRGRPRKTDDGLD
jgi:hypothetical protein